MCHGISESLSAGDYSMARPSLHSTAIETSSSSVKQEQIHYQLPQLLTLMLTPSQRGLSLPRTLGEQSVRDS